MIYGRLIRLGYESLSRESFDSFTKFKDAREKADSEIAAVLHEVGAQTGKQKTFPTQGGATSQPAPLGTYREFLQLKRAAAWAGEGAKKPPPFTGPDLTDDEKLSPLLGRTKEPARFAHLLLHAETSGYYVPLSFHKPFWLPETARSVGSAVGLSKELGELIPLLDSWGEEFSAELALAWRLEALTGEAVRQTLTVELVGEAELEKEK